MSTHVVVDNNDDDTTTTTTSTTTFIFIIIIIIIIIIVIIIIIKWSARTEANKTAQRKKEKAKLAATEVAWRSLTKPNWLKLASLDTSAVLNILGACLLL